MVSVILIGLSFTNKISDPAYFESFSQPKYTTVPKINPTVYNFQRPFLRGLFLEGLHFGGVYIRWEICVTKFIGLAYGWKANKKLSVTIPLLICYFVLFFFLFYLRAISKCNLPGPYINSEDRTIERRVFCITSLGGSYLKGLIHGGAYFRNFTVITKVSNPFFLPFFYERYTRLTTQWLQNYWVRSPTMGKIILKIES